MQLLIDPALIATHLDALAAIADQNDGIRASGTPGYDESAEYVAGELARLGLSVERRPFDFTFFDEAEPVKLRVGDLVWRSPDWLHADLYSAGGDVSGPLEFVARDSPSNGCDAGDWTSFTADHVAVVLGGSCSTREKVQLAQAGEALALIVLYPDWGRNQIGRPTLSDPAGIHIPVVSAGADPARALPDLDGAVAQLSVHVTTRTATVDNILGEMPGTDDDDVVMLGAHLDSVLDGPGINDNGSGVATVLATAAAVADRPPPAISIRFGFWAAEEFGDVGSIAYLINMAPAERSRISAYLNLDMVGSPNPGRFVYDEAAAAPGSPALTQQILEALELLGAPGRPLDIGGGSDHGAFARLGVPTGGVFSGLFPMTADEAAAFDGTAGARMDPCYHLACDGRDNVHLDSAVMLGQAIANVLAALAYQQP